MIRLLLGIIVVMASIGGARAQSAGPGLDVTRVFAKAELEEILGGTLKEPKIDSADLGTVRYYPVNGIPFLEALVLGARTYDAVDYESALKNAQQTHYYKHDVAGLGERAFWQESGAYAMLIAVKGKVLVQISISQAKSPLTREDAAIKIAKTTFERLAR